MPFDRVTKDQARAVVADLTGRYLAGRLAYESPSAGYLESQLRVDFLDEFLRAFGWDVRNDAGKPHTIRDVVVERSTDLDDDRLGRPDYTLRYDGKPRHVVEAKKAAIDLQASPSSAVQTRTYGWSLALPVAVLTNFRSTVFYDTKTAPQSGDAAHVAALPGKRFECDEYVARFDELWELLSFDTVESGSYESLFDYEEPPRGMSPFDRAFLDDLRDWRTSLATDIAQRNNLSSDEVGRRVQRLLNALIFLRVCEDRRIDDYEALLDAANSDQLIDRFRDADHLYNAGLFNVLDDTEVNIDVLRAVVAELYWPRSKYAYGLLRADVLASVYEQFLGERVELDDARIARLVPKPEVVHAGGIVATPAFIVDRLLDSSLQPAIDGDRGEDVRVLDMACGSGVFLVEAFRRLATAAEARHGPLSVADRSAIAKRHLFGVDIDPEAVEVAKLSLLLAILGDEWIDRTGAHHLLPDMSQNLVTGNSVVDEGFDARFPDAARDPERRSAVKPMTWMSAFPSVLNPTQTDRRGFDVIVGNPPYARIQVLAEHFEDHLRFFQDERSGFRTGHAFNFDLYMLFIERALGLLAEGGTLAMIVPHRFMRSPASAALRDLLTPRVEELVDFRHEQVFHGRTTYTCLLFAGGGQADTVPIEVVDDLHRWRAGEPPGRVVIERSKLGPNPWVYDLDERDELFQRVRDRCSRVVDDVAEVFVGVQTSDDDVFFIRPSGPPADGVVRFIDVTGVETEIEEAILRPGLKDARLVPYDVDPEPDVLAIFPYEFIAEEGKRRRAVPIDRAAMQARFPMALRYFDRHEGRLRARDVSPDWGDRFWAYGRSQSLTRLHPTKIVVRVLSVEPQYAIDTSGLVVAGGGDGGPYYLMRPKPDADMPAELLVALLSHPLIDTMVAVEGKSFRGGYFVHRKAFLIRCDPLMVPDTGQGGQQAACSEEDMQRWEDDPGSLRRRSATPCWRC